MACLCVCHLYTLATNEEATRGRRTQQLRRPHRTTSGRWLRLFLHSSCIGGESFTRLVEFRRRRDRSRFSSSIPDWIGLDWFGVVHRIKIRWVGLGFKGRGCHSVTLSWSGPYMGLVCGLGEDEIKHHHKRNTFLNKNGQSLHISTPNSQFIVNTIWEGLRTQETCIHENHN